MISYHSLSGNHKNLRSVFVGDNQRTCELSPSSKW